MRLMMVLLLAFAPPALARECPVPADHSARISALLEQVREADTAQEAQLITNAMWELWSQAPDAAAGCEGFVAPVILSGVTPQMAIKQARPDICITHAPGFMVISDIAASELAAGRGPEISSAPQSNE